MLRKGLMSGSLRAARLIGLVMAIAAGAAPAAAQALNDDIERALAKNKFSAERVGVSVVELSPSGAITSVLADLSAARAMVPASNQKVLTSGVALLVLGKDYQFRTEFRQSGDRLVIVGGGDPAFGDPVLLERSRAKLTVPQLLATIVQAIKDGGVASVSEIVIDDRVFDRSPRHPTWDARHLDKDYCPEVAGLSFHANLLSIFPAPARAKGQPAVIRLEPEAAFVEVENNAKTAGPRDPNTVRAERGPGSPAGVYRFRIMGEVSQPLSEPLELPVTESPTFFGMVLAEELAKAGVRVGTPGARSGAQAVRLAAEDEDLGPGRSLAVVTTPIADVLERCNTNSVNLYAECLVKMVGHQVTREPGSWKNGPEVVRMYLAQRLGPEFAASTTIVDGSGLSDDNRVAPATITRWLAMMASDTANAQTYMDYFASTRSPSLRMKKMARVGLRSQIQCKTGHINGVLSLSGYLTSPTQERVAFSIIYNEFKGYRGAEAVDMQEDVVKAIDAYLTRRR
jgi:D-alanyl-D-alanine carboxypeptidase/D-alanyl-D-alanine-endopeptidase (penicillin-binding protein 4)